MKVEIRLLSGEGITVDVENNLDIITSIRDFITELRKKKEAEILDMYNDDYRRLVEFNSVRMFEIIAIITEDKTLDLLDGTF